MFVFKLMSRLFPPSFSSCCETCSYLLMMANLPWKLALYCLSQLNFILLIFFLLHTAADDLTKSLLHHLPLYYATEITGFMTRPHQQFITYVLSGNELPVCGIGAWVHTRLEDPVQLFAVGLFFLFPSAVKIKKEEKYMLIFVIHVNPKFHERQRCLIPS